MCTHLSSDQFLRIFCRYFWTGAKPTTPFHSCPANIWLVSSSLMCVVILQLLHSWIIRTAYSPPAHPIPSILFSHTNPVHFLSHYIRESPLSSSSFHLGWQLHLQHHLSIISTSLLCTYPNQFSCDSLTLSPNYLYPSLTNHSQYLSPPTPPSLDSPSPLQCLSVPY